MLDEEGRTRLKLKVCSPPLVCMSMRLLFVMLLSREWPEFTLCLSQVENTIRWRAKRDEEGNEVRESNARIVKWSDGRCVLCCVCVWVWGGGGNALCSEQVALLSVVLNVFFILYCHSMSLHLGNEVFDVYKAPLQGDHNHLFIRQGTGLQGQAVFKTKLTFR